MLLSLIAAAALAFVDQSPQPKAATPAQVAAQPKVDPNKATVQEVCNVVTNSTVPNGQPISTPFPALQLGAVTPSTRLPGLPVSGASIVRCERSQFGMGDQDWRVLTEYRLPLLIVSPDAAGFLELQDGQFRLRMVKGGLTDQGAALFRQVLDKATADANASAARTSPAPQPAAQKQGSRPAAAPAQAKQKAGR